MDFFDAVKNRRSIRKYKDRPVEPEKLRKILDSARIAPSARNRQPWKFIVVSDSDVKRKVYKAARNQEFVLEAPVIIAAVGYPTDYVCGNGNIAHQVDLGIVGEHIALSASALGLGTCWIAAFYQGKMRKALEIPEDAHIVAIFALGYPDEMPKPLVRKPLDSIVYENKWNGDTPEWAK